MSSTINIVGTGGIIEGNFETANVNVNLDPVYGNFNATTSSSLSNDNDFDDMWAGNGGLISAWIYPKSDGEGDYGRIAQKGWEFNLREESSGFVKVQFYHGFSTTAGNWKTTNAAVALNAWNHLALFYDSDATGNDPVIYVNGVSQAITETSTPAGTRTDDAAQTLYIGNNNTGARTFDGYIMDIKIYKNTAWTQAEVAVLASKINVDKDHPGLPAPGPRLYLWWKGNASTGTDSSGSGNNLTPSNLGSVVYDAFSVDVYDNSTTTDGSFTVTQGKVEGLSLSSPDFDGSADYIEKDSISGMPQTKGTVAFWFNPDSLSGERALTDLIDASSSTSNRVLCYLVSGEARLLVSGTLAAQWNYGTTIATGRWSHFLATWNSTDDEYKIYIDGILRVTSTTSIADSSGIDKIVIARDKGGEFDFDGHLRDYKIYSYVLSDAQASSLYSNSFNVTPDIVWYKLNEGSYNALTSYGTKTSMDVTGTSLSWENGTLDLDGTLTIAANGTLSAPRGNLTISGGGDAFDNNGTDPTTSLIHNDGTVTIDGGNMALRGGTSSTGTHFYNLTQDGSGYIDGYERYTVENKLTTKAGVSYYMNGDNYIYIGTSTVAGEFEMNGAMNFTTNGQCYIEGAGGPSLPALIDYNGSHSGVSGDTGGATAYLNLTNINWDGALTMGTSNIKLGGDAEFDAVTVSSGAELDLNGQRAEFSGTLNIDGTLDADGLIVSSGSIDEDGGFSNADSCDMILTGAVGHDFRGATHRNIMINTGTGTSTNNATKDLGTTPFTIGSGTFSNGASGRNLTCGNFTIATGGTYTADDATVTVAGDFTTSGGLIGKSALDFDGTNDYVDLSNDSDWQFGTSNFTLEAWFRSDGGSGNRTIIANGDASDNGFLLYMQSSNNIKFFVNNIAVCNAADVSYEDSKWHHVAAVRDGNDYLLYIDGKLKDKSTQSSQNLTHAGKASIGARDISATADAYWEGQIAMVRAFNDARTPSELRADMFNAHANMANTGNLVAMYQFDEGTGSTVDNIETDADLDGTISGASWVGSGTFTYGTSTLVMAKSGTQKLTYLNGEDVYNLTINDGSTTQLISPDSSAGILDIYGNLIVNEKLEGSGVDSEQIKIRGSGKTLTIGSDVRTTAMADLTRMYIDESITIPESTHKRIVVNGNTTTAGGDLTITVELEVNSGTTFNANGNTIQTQDLDVNGGTLDLRNSTVNLTREANFGINLDNDAASINLLTGNTTINGNANPSAFWVPAVGNFEIVGDVSNMIVRTGGDLTIIGSATNCSAEDSTAGLRQWHHTLDTQQLLDADEAGDDDLRLEKPNLDNANELQTG